MKRNKAIKIAISSMEKEMKRLAFNANLQEVFRADIPSAIDALKRKKELQEAIEELKNDHQIRLRL